MAEHRLLAVHAHADDESITMGGTLATYADRGVETTVICCTDGKLATIVAADMPEESTRPQLVAIRQDELRAACSILGVTNVEFLHYGDSGMAGAESNDYPDAFWRADINQAVGELVTHIRARRPQVVVTYNANGGYGHPDHIQAHRVTLLAVEAAANHSLYPDAGEAWRVDKLYYTVFARSDAETIIEMAKAAGMPSPFGASTIGGIPFVTPDEHVTTRIDVAEAIPRRRQAMLAHRSQMDESFPMLAVPDEVIRQALPHESYQLVISHVFSEKPETDLFAGIA